MIHIPRTLLCLVAAGCVASAASAQNLLANSDFDSGLGLDSWVQGNGSWELGADSGGCLLSDSAAGTSAEVGGNQAMTLYSQQCIEVDPVATPELYLGGLYQATANVYARLYLQFFSDAGCATHNGWSAFAFGGTSPNWDSILGPIPIPLVALSARVWVDVIPASPSEPQFTASFDRLYLGVQPQVFLDGFETESGSACHWSSIVP